MRRLVSQSFGALELHADNLKAIVGALKAPGKIVIISDGVQYDSLDEFLMDGRKHPPKIVRIVADHWLTTVEITQNRSYVEILGLTGAQDDSNLMIIYEEICRILSSRERKTNQLYKLLGPIVIFLVLGARVLNIDMNTAAHSNAYGMISVALSIGAAILFIAIALSIFNVIAPAHRSVNDAIDERRRAGATKRATIAAFALLVMSIVLLPKVELARPERDSAEAPSVAPSAWTPKKVKALPPRPGPRVEEFSAAPAPVSIFDDIKDAPKTVKPVSVRPDGSLAQTGAAPPEGPAEPR